ncbi:unnamed protein product [Orchesella dallaii]|uniref:Zinc-binding domain-containing protein n=1 Tax=Orchesella dallaii TaxID=48710 RepID=A0ABP1PME8_9HEXA
MGRRNRKVKEVYIKAVAVFVCSKETCKKSWASRHSWKQSLEYCEDCGKKAYLADMKEYKLHLDNFNCDYCEDFWESLHDENDSMQECDCGEEVWADGSQKRFGRHFWWRCNGCDFSWENHDTDRVFSQRCTKCGSRGNVHHLELEKAKNKKKSSKKRHDDDAGGHVASHCDMCQHLIPSGSRSDCTGAQVVECREKRSKGGYSKLQMIVRK